MIPQAKPEETASAAQDPSCVLIIDDSRAYAADMAQVITTSTGLTPIFATTLDAARAVLAVGRDKLLAALVDINLPDAATGEAVRLVTSSGVPAIPVTGDISEATQEKMWTLPIVDYVLKEGPSTRAHVAALLRRLIRNRKRSVLVVDDGRTTRMLLKRMLEVQLLTVVEADTAAAAIEAVTSNPAIRLVLTDYVLPDLDGVSLTRRLRTLRPPDALAILSLSASSDPSTAIRFVKSGASDFIAKPYTRELLYCRVGHALDTLDQFETIRTLSETDALTGLRNRRYFMTTAPTLLASAARGRANVALAMLDIDHFKRVNDTYGHAVGDEVLTAVGRLLGTSFRASDIAARVGGEEFCLLATNLDRDAATKKFDSVRKSIAALSFETEGGPLRVTASIGVATESGQSVETMMKTADAFLYEAKRSGRDRVVVGSSDG